MSETFKNYIRRCAEACRCNGELTAKTDGFMMAEKLAEKLDNDGAGGGGGGVFLVPFAWSPSAGLPADAPRGSKGVLTTTMSVDEVLAAIKSGKIVMADVQVTFSNGETDQVFAAFSGYDPEYGATFAYNYIEFSFEGFATRIFVMKPTATGPAVAYAFDSGIPS